MPTSGLVITLQPDPAAQTAALSRLRARPEFTLGEVSDRWLPAALEARDDAESRDLHDWLASLPGVAFVDVVSVNFETSGTSESTTSEAVPAVCNRRPWEPAARSGPKQSTRNAAAASRRHGVRESNRESFSSVEPLPP